MIENKFDTQGFVYIESLLDESTVSIVSEYFENRMKRGEWLERTDQNGDLTTKLCYYADPLIEVLLKAVKPDVEKACGKELETSYSYARIYQPGESLLPHLDRPACEFSVTVSVAYKGEPSPIYMQYLDHDPVKFTLKPGCAVVYKGCETTHWRRAVKEDCLVVQFMLHYVEKNGINKEYMLDGRAGLGYPSIKRKI